MTPIDKHQDELTAAFAAILSSSRATEIEQERVFSFLRESGLQALIDFSSQEIIRNSLALSRPTARALDSLRVILSASREKCNDQLVPMTREQIAEDMRALRHEEMRGIYFNGSGAIIHAQTVAIGDASEVSLDPYAALRPAFVLGARTMELLHNHPSGNSEPSSKDITSCRVIAEAASRVGIRLELLWIVTLESMRRHSLA